jgi:KipI family sensor histidine kinase inhibitor
MASRSIPVGEIRRFGDHALLIGVVDPTAARGLVRAINAAGMDQVAEVVGGLATVLVVFDVGEDDPDRHRPHLSALGARSAEASGRGGVEGGDGEEGADHVIQAVFDGPDLDQVAASAGCPPERVIELFVGADFTVNVVGFAPGFAYLGGLPPELRHIARRARPRPAVPPGSIALAHGQAAVYPAASPGGWQLIGHTDAQLFSPWSPPYARLAPGDRVRFSTEGPDDERPGDSWRPGAAPSITTYPATGRPVFEVEEAGLRTVLQDAGRRGVAALGVPGAGAADPDSFQLANRLVGNRDGAAGLEVTARGPTLRCLSSTFVAVVGGSPDLWVQGQSVAPGRVVPVAAGQLLAVGVVRGGLRTYVAVAGGFLGFELLGSYSTDQLSGLGPGPLGRMAQLWAGAMELPLGDHLAEDLRAAPDDGEAITLRVVPGPHPEQFGPDAFESLAAARFTVEPDSNRVGLRLRRDPQSTPLGVRPGPELDSQGMVTGAVQVPPNGEPVILLPDHATLGGYPVVAAVAAVDHGRLGQCAPGAIVRLDPITHAQAQAALRQQRRRLDAAVVGHYPLAVE